MRRRPIPPALVACLTAVVSLAIPSSAVAQTPTVEDLTTRAGHYIADFIERFSNVVAEERYQQDVMYTRPSNLIITGRGSTPTPGGSAPATMRRDLKSDFLLVTLPETTTLTPFRDVFEVDGRSVRDRGQRLEKLFLKSSANILDQLTAIAEEGARYNIGNLKRTVNNPILALIFLQSGNQAGMHFSLSKLDQGTGPDVWIVEYKEEARPTMIRGAFDRDLPAHGRVWISASTGRVARTEIIFNDPQVTAEVMTSFKTDDRFGIDVPSEMREQYTMGNTLVTGDAKYGRFRRFEVDTREQLEVKKDESKKDAPKK